MWVEKHKPFDISHMIGNEHARLSIINWFKNWNIGTKPIMLIGPPGVGKTTIITIAAKKFDYDILSLNASDIRNKKQIHDIIVPAINNLSIFGKSMIFIDEVDGIHGKSDYGGVEELIKIMKEPIVPIVLAANVDNTDKMKSVKKLTKIIHFDPIPPRLMLLYIKNILKDENILLDQNSLLDILKKSHGDVRSTINLTQAFVNGFKNVQLNNPLCNGIESCINHFFKSKSLEEARNILFSINIDPFTKINSFYSSIITCNIPIKIMTKMLQTISKADMLYGKIIKTQSWHLLRYLDSILLELYYQNLQITYSKFNISWSLVNKIRFNGRTVKSISSIFAKKFHISKSVFAIIYLPYMLYCIKNKTLQINDNETLIKLNTLDLV